MTNIKVGKKVKFKDHFAVCKLYIYMYFYAFFQTLCPATVFYIVVIIASKSGSILWTYYVWLYMYLRSTGFHFNGNVMIYHIPWST